MNIQVSLHARGVGAGSGAGVNCRWEQQLRFNFFWWVVDFPEWTSVRSTRSNEIKEAYSFSTWK